MSYHGWKLEFYSNTNCRKPTNSWKLNNAQLNHHWVKEEIKKKIKDFLEFNEKWMYNIPKLMGHYESSAKMKVQSTKCSQKNRLPNVAKTSMRSRRQFSQNLGRERRWWETWATPETITTIKTKHKHSKKHKVNCKTTTSKNTDNKWTWIARPQGIHLRHNSCP